MPLNISPSRLKLFEDCGYAFYCKYFLNLPDVAGDKTRLGSALHSLFELLAKPSRIKRKEYVVFTKKTGLLHLVVKRLLSKLYGQYKIPEELRELGNKLILENFCRGYDIDSKVIEVEKEFTIPIAGGINIHGYIDRISEISKDTIILVDYKSGAPFNEAQCRKELQPFFYKMAAKVLYPQYKNVLFEFYFLKNKKIISVHKTDNELSEFKEKLLEAAKRMLNFTKENAIPNKTWKCNFCQFKNPRPEVKFLGCPAHFDKNGQSLWKD